MFVVIVCQYFTPFFLRIYSVLAFLPGRKSGLPTKFESAEKIFMDAWIILWVENVESLVFLERKESLPKNMRVYHIYSETEQQ